MSDSMMSVQQYREAYAREALGRQRHYNVLVKHGSQIATMLQMLRAMAPGSTSYRRLGSAINQHNELYRSERARRDAWIRSAL